MAITTKIARSGKAISLALEELSSSEAAQFDREYRDALVRAAATFDLTEAETLLTRWWGIVNLRANPLTEEEHDLIRRFHAGEDVGRPSSTAQTAASRPHPSEVARYAVGWVDIADDQYQALPDQHQ